MDTNWRNALQKIKHEQLKKRGDFEADPEVEAFVTALVTHTASWGPGALLSWDDVTDLTGLTREDSRFWTVVKKWRDKLRKERHIETWCMTANEGVTLLDDVQNIEIVARKRTLKSIRQSKRVLAAIANTDTAKLSDKQMLVAHHYAERAKAAIKRGQVKPKRAEDIKG